MFTLYIKKLQYIYIPIWLDLLSNIRGTHGYSYLIYIPIWLDLLLELNKKLDKLDENLHSNMVRFIIRNETRQNSILVKFTFQYG